MASASKRTLRSILSEAIGFGREAVWYATHLLRGSAYHEYYAARMDRLITRNPNWGCNLTKEFQLEYLRRHGLLPSMTLMDFGCGAMVAGALFVRFLDRGHYFGVDISPKVLEEGRQRIRSWGLEDKNPVLLHINSLSLEPLQGRKYDVVWAQSVFTHMPPADIRAVLREIRVLMHCESIFFATYAWCDAGPERKRFKDWYYDFHFFQESGRQAGLAVEQMDDWQHPDDTAGVDRMLRFTILC